MDEKKKKKKADGEQKERKKNWREVYATVEDIKAFLSDRIFLRHNVITGRVECRALDSDRDSNGEMFCACSDPQPPNLGGLWQPINDRIVN